MRLDRLCVACVTIILVACTAPTPQAAPSAASAVDPTPTAPPMPALDPARVAHGQQLYGQHCASCHGATLQGQPDWKQPLPNGKYPAPPHDDTGHTWHHPDPVLIQIILEGGNGTGGTIPSDMPAFKAVLGEDDARDILQYLKSRWSPDKRAYQWQMTTQTTQQ